jgi:hypothetical protein
MGAWSHDSFGNDDACDFASELERSNDLSVIEAALDSVLDAGDQYLEAPEASRAVAAAEGVARLQGNWGKRDSYSEAVDAWVTRVKINPSDAIAQKARRVLDRIMTEPSELLELWQEGEDGGAWVAAIRDLKGRIRA